MNERFAQFSVVIIDDGRPFYEAVVCPERNCGAVTSDVWQMRCHNGHIMNEMRLNGPELSIVTARWN